MPSRTPTENPQTITRDLPMQTREASIVPGSYDEAQKTVDVLWTTGAQGRRVDEAEDGSRFLYDEELSLDPAHVNMGRFDRGVVQVIDAHQVGRGLSSVIGIATRGWIDGGAGYARLRLSVDPGHAGIVSNIRAGILRAISFGYWVHEYQLIALEDRTDGGLLPLLRATKWEVYELSFVPVGFDRDAMSLSRSALPDHIAKILTRSAVAGLNHTERTMPHPTGAENAATNTSSATSQADALTAERTRSAEITVLCRDAGVPDQAEAMIRDGVTVEQAGLRILRARAAADRSSGGHVNVQTQRDEVETKLRGIEEALTSRLDPTAKLTDNGRQYRGLSMLELGNELLEAGGVKTRGMSRTQRAGHVMRMRSAPGYMHTTDFGSVLGGLGARRLAAAYTAVPTTYETWARRAPNAPNLHDIQIIELSSGPELADVGESGEYTYGAYRDTGKSYRIRKAGKIVSLTEEMLINDDLRAFDRVVADFGAASRRRENMMVYASLTGSSVMSDDKQLFDAAHGNLLTGATSKLTLDALRAARKLMRKQTSFAAPNEKALPLNISARFLLVPSDIETEGGILTSANYQPTTRDATNEFAAGQRSALQLVVEPLLDAAPDTWYMAADASQMDTVEYCYLDGQEGPVIEQRNGWEVDGIEFKCKHRFASTAANWRGLVKAVGA